MRYVTVAENKGTHIPKGEKHHCRLFRMLPGTAWKVDPYGKHEVVEVSEEQVKKSIYGYCTMHFDGREMAIFNIGEQEYLQPTAEHEKATDRRLGSKRKIRKLKKPRRDAPGVAPQAINAENEGPEPQEDREEKRATKRARRLDLGATEEAPRARKGRRTGPRGGLSL
jgi:hypothetical protein